MLCLGTQNRLSERLCCRENQLKAIALSKTKCNETYQNQKEYLKKKKAFPNPTLKMQISFSVGSRRTIILKHVQLQHLIGLRYRHIYHNVKVVQGLTCDL